MSEVKEYDMNMLAVLGIVGGLIGIFAAYLLDTQLNVTYFAFLGAAGAILATVWGADAVRRICKYGIGTGVPSIGMLAFGMGLLTTLLGLKIGDYLVANQGNSYYLYAGPVIALVLSLVQGAIIGFIANSVLKMKIPTMQIGMIYIAGAASLILMGFTVAITGSFGYSVMISKVFDTGIIAPLFMIGALPMLHPFNASLGPDENQKRTLILAVEVCIIDHDHVRHHLDRVPGHNHVADHRCARPDRLGDRIHGILQESQGKRCPNPQHGRTSKEGGLIHGWN